MVEFKESLQYHNFFQKIYGNGSKDDLCYGMGIKVPRVPFNLQTIPDKRNDPPPLAFPSCASDGVPSPPPAML
jgi:hypothetical protein